MAKLTSFPEEGEKVVRKYFLEGRQAERIKNYHKHNCNEPEEVSKELYSQCGCAWDNVQIHCKNNEIEAIYKIFTEEEQRCKVTHQSICDELLNRTLF